MAKQTFRMSIPNPLKSGSSGIKKNTKPSRSTVKVNCVVKAGLTWNKSRLSDCKIARELLFKIIVVSCCDIFSVIVGVYWIVNNDGIYDG